MTAEYRARAVGALDAAIGLALLTRPSTLAPPGTGRREALVVRVLGARSAAQGLTLLARPSGELLLRAGSVDLTHAATMVALAGARPRYRHGALRSALLAMVTGSLSIIAARAMSVPARP